MRPLTLITVRVRIASGLKPWLPMAAPLRRISGLLLNTIRKDLHLPLSKKRLLPRSGRTKGNIPSNRMLRRLLSQLSTRRRFQLAGLLFLMFVGAAAELGTIAAVLPFLALIADP